MTKDEALRLALEAFNNLAAWNDGEVGSHMDEPYSAEVSREAIIAIKSALSGEAQTRSVVKDEAVAWMWMPTGEVTTDPDRADGMWEPLFLAPPQRTWVGLTDEEMDNFVKAAWGQGVTAADFIRAIEAKLKEKNA